MKRVQRSLAILTAVAIAPVFAQQPPDVVPSDTLGNTAMGNGAMEHIDTGVRDGFFGARRDTAAGDQSLFTNTTGAYDTAFGVDTLFYGNSNTALGLESLFSNTVGSNNIAVGVSAGYNLTTDSNDIDIGNKGVAGESGTIRLGTPATHAATYIAGISTAHVTGAAVFVTSTGQLGVFASSERYKTAIAPIGAAATKL